MGVYFSWVLFGLDKNSITAQQIGLARQHTIIIIITLFFFFFLSLIVFFLFDYIRIHFTMIMFTGYLIVAVTIALVAIRTVATSRVQRGFTFLRRPLELIFKRSPESLFELL